MASTIKALKILTHSKLKLLDEYLFECVQIVLLIKDEHCFFVIDGIHRAETQRTIAVGYKYGIARDACGTLVAVRKYLNILQQHKSQQGFLEHIVLGVDKLACIVHGPTAISLREDKGL